jgi:hypothetical protein
MDRAWTEHGQSMDTSDFALSLVVALSDFKKPELKEVA